MKKIGTLVIALLPVLAMAQKEVKPSVSKAEKNLQEGKLEEAKEIIDVTVYNKEFMVDKKGKPSKNAAEAWFVRGLIYASMDTTRGDKYKALSPNLYDSAIKSFNKQKELAGTGDPGTYLKDLKTYVPIMNQNLMNNLSASYFNASTAAYNKEKNYKKAFSNMEKAIYFVPKTDTSLVMYAGVYFGPGAEEYDKSITYINEYIARGGNDATAYQQLISILIDKKKDQEGAIKVIHLAEKKWPTSEEFPKYELNMYLADKKYKEAAKIVKTQIRMKPGESSSYYMLGQLYDRTNQPDSSRIAFQKAIDLDPANWDANLELAKSYLAEGKRIKLMRDRLGISASDIAQRKVLLEKQREEYKISLPYWEKLEKLKPDDEDVLYTLQEIYTSLVMDDQAARVEKRIKALGLDK